MSGAFDEQRERAQRFLAEAGLHDGRMMSYSKSGYSFAHPANIDVFIIRPRSRWRALVCVR